MTEAEIVAYLMRWLLEFGSDWVPASLRGRNTWYMLPTTRHPARFPIDRYMVSSSNDMTDPTGSFKINEKGFDLIRRYHDQS